MWFQIQRIPLVPHLVGPTLTCDTVVFAMFSTTTEMRMWNADQTSDLDGFFLWTKINLLLYYIIIIIKKNGVDRMRILWFVIHSFTWRHTTAITWYRGHDEGQ